MKPGGPCERMAALVRRLQDQFCSRLEALDGTGRFGRDEWARPGGGGGVTRVLADGAVLERAGVNVAVVGGELPEGSAAAAEAGGRRFFAAGLSVILHPLSPFVPAAHLNVRCFETEEAGAWFGGGADLTPFYLEEDDVRHFHATLRDACAAWGPGAYPRFKKACDAYFFLPHRGETRGVGGVFFDRLGEDLERGFALVEALGRAFLPAWVPIVERRKAEVWTPRERAWQCLRRGRYVEFNLLFDRGTRFGLETGGRVESVLTSLPPWARWEYGHEPEPGSREAELLAVLRAPREWID